MDQGPVNKLKKSIDTLMQAVNELFKRPPPYAKRADNVALIDGKKGEDFVKDIHGRMEIHKNDENNPHNVSVKDVDAPNNQQIDDRLANVIPEGDIPISGFGPVGYLKLPLITDANAVSVTIPSYSCVINGHYHQLEPLTVKFTKGQYETRHIYIRLVRDKVVYIVRNAGEHRYPDTYVTMYIGIVTYSEYGGLGGVIPSASRVDIFTPDNYGYRSPVIPASGDSDSRADHLPATYL